MDFSVVDHDKMLGISGYRDVIMDISMPLNTLQILLDFMSA